jgi:hypothetical protein
VGFGATTRAARSGPTARSRRRAPGTCSASRRWPRAKCGRWRRGSGRGTCPVLHNLTPAVGMGFQGLLPSGQPPAAHSRHRHIHRDIHPAVTCISWVLPARRGGFGSVDPPENHPAARLPHSPAHALGFGRVALSPHHGPHAISKLSLCPRSTLRPCQPPGEPRRYIGMIILPSTMLTFGLYFKPETRAVAWAREEAQRQLAEAN